MRTQRRRTEGFTGMFLSGEQKAGCVVFDDCADCPYERKSTATITLRKRQSKHFSH
jgi:hypothetical protein